MVKVGACGRRRAGVIIDGDVQTLPAGELRTAVSHEWRPAGCPILAVLARMQVRAV
jgi:hypothetical protein